MSGVAGCGDGLVQGWETIELSKVRAVMHQWTHSTAKGPPFPSLPRRAQSAIPLLVRAMPTGDGQYLQHLRTTAGSLQDTQMECSCNKRQWVFRPAMFIQQGDQC